MPWLMWRRADRARQQRQIARRTQESGTDEDGQQDIGLGCVSGEVLDDAPGAGVRPVQVLDEIERDLDHVACRLQSPSATTTGDISDRSASRPPRERSADRKTVGC